MTKVVVYLASGYGLLDTNFTVIYNDYLVPSDLNCDMLEVDLAPFDILIASPPCNYYSRANYRRDISSYSLSTKHLLPCILEKFIQSDKPFIIENVLNKPLMFDMINSLPFGVFYFEIGRHCYFTNVNFYYHDLVFPVEHVKFLSQKKRQGSGGVNIVFNRFLKAVELYD